MNLYKIKYLIFRKNINIKVKRKNNGKINLYSHCIDCGFNKFEIIDKEELSYF